MSKTVLKCLQDFAAGKGAYVTGQEIDMADVETWPDSQGSLQRRLTNGFVEYAVSEEEPVAPPKKQAAKGEVVLK